MFKQRKIKRLIKSKTAFLNVLRDLLSKCKDSNRIIEYKARIKEHECFISELNEI
jgi:hypothetical protein